MNGFRFNVIDAEGVVSFLGPRHGSKMIAAACGANHTSLDGVLTYLYGLDEIWAEDVRLGLAAFDARGADLDAEPDWARPFRVRDQVSRQESMKPGALGLLVINLKEQRIVQVHNPTTALRRMDRGRVRRNGKPTRMLFRYRLPPAWALVP